MVRGREVGAESEAMIQLGACLLEDEPCSTDLVTDMADTKAPSFFVMALKPGMDIEVVTSPAFPS